MRRHDVVRVGVIGLGFMGRAHLLAYLRAREAGFANEIVAVCDRRPEKVDRLGEVRGNVDLGEAPGPLLDPLGVRRYERVEELLADDAVDLVSIATPTPTHVPYALAALDAGKHVLVEKPVALDVAAAERFATAAERAALKGVVCMPALCMRFWPAWRWAADRIRAGTFGAPRSVSLRRLGPRPTWSPFYADEAASGGALFDLHVHDADYVVHLFGEPRWVAASGSVDHLTALYRFPAGPAHAAAEGGWDAAPGTPFVMRARFDLEEATVDFELGRSPELLLHRRGATEEADLGDVRARFGRDGYEGEVRHLLESVRRGGGGLLASPQEVPTVTRLLERERRALEPWR